ncbi:MAG: formylglycine-generating enzyme family protein, partial [Anaerolineaceae bacterium]|nr:formylglycine-generating enzyme family protein [Anaerolineaceae bacterium]
RRLQTRALEWERRNKDKSLLLRGRDLEEAEQQISVNATKDPNPTDLQREYTLISRQATDRQRRITTGSLVSAIVVLLGIIGALVYPSIAEFFAIREARGELIRIEGGSFFMGATDPAVIATGEREAWTATLPTFYMEKYEVTNRQYSLCVKHGGCTPPPDLDYFQAPETQEHPVLGVNVYQAGVYCAWVGRRLPTELEWIRAARGLDDPRYWPWGDTPPNSELANMPFENTLEPSPQSVTIYSAHPSPEGVVNLVGNALEWTSSYYQEGYYYGGEDYNSSNFWDGETDTYDGGKIFIRLGGGWERPTSYIAEVAPIPGYNTDTNTGMRCASR